MEASKLVTQTSFKGSLQSLEKLNAGLTKSVKTINVASVAITKIGLALNELTNKTLKSTYKNIELSNSLGVDIESLQKWQYIAGQTGSSTEALSSSFKSLNNKVFDYVNLNKGDAKIIFENLGISAKYSNGQLKQTDAIFEELSSKLKGFDVTKQKAILNKLGIDETMISAMNLTANKIDFLKDKASAWGLVTKKQAEQVTKYNKSLTDLGFGVESLKTQLAISLAPVLERTITKFKNWYLQNKQLVGEGIGKVSRALEIMGSALSNTFNFINMLIASTIGWNKALVLLTAGILYLNRAFLASPIGRIISLFSLFTLVVDDITVALRGGDSAIGSFFASMNLDFAKTAIATFSLLKSVFYGISTAVLANIELFATLFSYLEKGGKYIGIDFGFDIEGHRKKISDLRKEYQDLAIQNAENAFSQNIKIDKNIPFLNQNSILPKNINNNSQAINNTQNNNVQIEVKADNPVLAGESVKNALNKQINTANKQFSTGGM